MKLWLDYVIGAAHVVECSDGVTKATLSVAEVTVRPHRVLEDGLMGLFLSLLPLRSAGIADIHDDLEGVGTVKE